MLNHNLLPSMNIFFLRLPGHQKNSRRFCSVFGIARPLCATWVEQGWGLISMGSLRLGSLAFSKVRPIYLLSKLLHLVGGKNQNCLRHMSPNGISSISICAGFLPSTNYKYQVLITLIGTRYQTSVLCVTLHNTRRIHRSDWRPLCGHHRCDQRYSCVFVERIGGEAHHDPRCPRMGMRWPTTYQCCQRCPRFNSDYTGPWADHP